MPNTISSCLIVRDAVKTLPKLVMQISSFSDEVIINDTGSIDGTLEWAQQCGNPKLKLFQNPWEKDFALARNQSFDKASMEWIFWVDADDELSPELIKWMNEFRERDIPVDKDCVVLNYLYGPGSNVPNYRLIKRTRFIKWVGRCHEFPSMESCNYIDATDVGDIIHKRGEKHSLRNLEIFIKQMCDCKSMAEITCRDLTYYANELTCLSKQKAFDVYAWLCKQRGLCMFDLANIICTMHGLAEEGSVSWQQFNNAMAHAEFEVDTLRADAVAAIGDGWTHREGMKDEDLRFIKDIARLAQKRVEEARSWDPVSKYGYDERKTLAKIGWLNKFWNGKIVKPKEEEREKEVTSQWVVNTKDVPNLGYVYIKD